MKRFLTLTILSLFLIQISYAQQTDTIILNNITGTVYNAVPGQCNEDHLHTADGSFINKDEIGNLNWIAISRDLEEKGLKMGDIIEIFHDDEDICGIYEVHDRMHPRWTNKIDFLVPDSVKYGKWENITITKMY